MKNCYKKAPVVENTHFLNLNNFQKNQYIEKSFYTQIISPFAILFADFIIGFERKDTTLGTPNIGPYLQRRWVQQAHTRTSAGH